MSHYKLNKKCQKCGKQLLDRNKSGFCIHHINRSGKNNSFYGKHHSQENIVKNKEKNSIKSKENWKNLEYRNKVIKGISKPRNENFGEKQSKVLIEMYKNHPEQKEIRSIAMKKSWVDGKIIKNGYSCNKSKLQKELLENIKKICFDDLSVKTIRLSDNSYLFPDIVIGKTGIIIEFFGDFWHGNPKKYKETDIVHHGLKAGDIWEADKKRIKKLENEGYKVIIVWEDDYKNRKTDILNSLDYLINWEGCAL